MWPTGAPRLAGPFPTLSRSVLGLSGQNAGLAVPALGDVFSRVLAHLPPRESWLGSEFLGLFMGPATLHLPRGF